MLRPAGAGNRAGRAGPIKLQALKPVRASSRSNIACACSAPQNRWRFEAHFLHPPCGFLPDPLGPTQRAARSFIVLWRYGTCCGPWFLAWRIFWADLQVVRLEFAASFDLNLAPGASHGSRWSPDRLKKKCWRRLRPLMVKCVSDPNDRRWFYCILSCLYLHSVHRSKALTMKEIQAFAANVTLQAPYTVCGNAECIKVRQQVANVRFSSAAYIPTHSA